MKCSWPINIRHPTSDSDIFHFLYDWQGSVSGGGGGTNTQSTYSEFHSVAQFQFQPMAQPCAAS